MNAKPLNFRTMVRYRWLWGGIAGVILGIALFSEVAQLSWAPVFRFLVWGLALGGLGLVALLIRNQEQMHQRKDEADRLVAEAYQRLEAIFRISQKFVEARDENEVVDLVLNLSVELVGATGASFVPLDEHGQPLTAVSQGEMPFPVLNAWVEYLASPAIRDRCRTCESHASLQTSCPLLSGPFSGAIGMFCLPLKRGEREFGVLNLFMPNVDRLDVKTQAFLRAMMDETALALEGVRLRRRELEALRQMQALRQKTDLTTVLTGLLENVQQTVEADFAALAVQQEPGNIQPSITLGDFPSQGRPFLEGILQGVVVSGESLLLGDVAGNPASTPTVRSLMAVPLLSEEGSVLGVLVVGNRRSQSFHPRQLALMQTVAGQGALLVQNANLMAELVYKTTIEERTRLAREIHDGLAQTLGFLKLQVAQMHNYLARNDLERLDQIIDSSYDTLSEAYQDARQAIDGLRIWPAERGLRGWLEQTVEDFQDVSGLPVVLENVDLPVALPPEIQAQLIRVVQEALSNVRKHAEASQVWLTMQKIGGDLWLEIRDNGCGFSPEDVPGPSQHGLRGMRERAELIGADFQVISCSQSGTTVRVCLPLEGLQLGEIDS